MCKKYCRMEVRLRPQNPFCGSPEERKRLCFSALVQSISFGEDRTFPVMNPMAAGTIFFPLEYHGI